MKYYLKKDFSSAFEFLKKCDKTCENWNIDKLIKYDYVVEVCDENDNIIATFTHKNLTDKVTWSKGFMAGIKYKEK